jgi:hypothetical protein
MLENESNATREHKHCSITQSVEKENFPGILERSREEMVAKIS